MLMCLRCIPAYPRVLLAAVPKTPLQVCAVLISTRLMQALPSWMHTHGPASTFGSVVVECTNYFLALLGVLPMPWELLHKPQEHPVPAAGPQQQLPAVVRWATHESVPAGWVHVAMPCLVVVLCLLRSLAMPVSG